VSVTTAPGHVTGKGIGTRSRTLDRREMGRCEGYYRVENRRCDRDGSEQVRGGDGESYVVCGYHARQGWATNVARWNGETGIRRSAPTRLVRESAAAA
jgi:hypothetical protein